MRLAHVLASAAVSLALLAGCGVVEAPRPDPEIAGSFLAVFRSDGSLLKTWRSDGETRRRDGTLPAPRALPGRARVLVDGDVVEVETSRVLHSLGDISTDFFADGACLLSTSGGEGLRSYNLESFEERVVVAAGAVDLPRCAEGRVVFVRKSSPGPPSLWSVGLDGSGERLLVQLPVGSDPNLIDVSPDGRWVLLSSSAFPITLVDLETTSVDTLDGLRGSQGRFSADGRSVVAIRLETPPSEPFRRLGLATFDLNSRQLTDDPGGDLPYATLASDVVITPGARRVYVRGIRPGEEVYVRERRSDGAGWSPLPTLGGYGRTADLCSYESRNWALDVSPDGQHVLVGYRIEWTGCPS